MSILDKEIRLSFAKRIRETVPEPYHKLITEGKFKDVPDYKYASDRKFPSSIPFTSTLLNSSIRNSVLHRRQRTP
jgi:hypothetical protein